MNGPVLSNVQETPRRIHQLIEDHRLCFKNAEVISVLIEKFAIVKNRLQSFHFLKNIHVAYLQTDSDSCYWWEMLSKYL